jgi:hypothetical protein
MTTEKLNELFLRIAEELDISDTLFDKAVTSYTTLGEYINNHCDRPVNVYMQGSFRLGTVIRPLNDEDEYDLDLVSEVVGATNISSKDLKKLIGDILRDSKRYSSMLEEKKRCWRIVYSDEAQFHMDITPAIPDSSATDAILVTNKMDNGAYSYSASNPKGYSDWFEKRKATSEMIHEAASFTSAGVEPVKTKDNNTKLPLQRAIQVLKRHRDKTFEDNSDDKPISIIITTLSAMAYEGELGVYDALVRVLQTMHTFIKLDSGKYIISNPSNPKENFADKWNSEPVKAKAFFDWLQRAKSDIVSFAPTIVDDYTGLEDSLGDTVVSRAVSGIAPVTHDSDLPANVYGSPSIKNALSVSHRVKPPFKLPKYQNLGIKAVVTSNGSSYTYKNNGEAIPKNCSIDFSLLVSPKLLHGSYTVKWQVVNTGYEAQRADCLRGGFETERNSTKRHEGSEYQGTHYVQAFLLKRGKCIAMSKEFIVNIR